MTYKKHVTLKSEARQGLLDGIEILSEAVGSTLGARGKSVIYQYGDKTDGIPLVTKDGVTVASHINLIDPVQNLGVQLVRNAAQQTARKAGDGTTTSTVLTYNLLKDSITKNVSRDFIEGMECAFNKTLLYLEKISEDVDNDILNYVASISTNNDKELGDLIAGAIKEAGEYGTVGWEPNMDGVETYVNIEHGAQIPRGYIDPAFINNKQMGRVDLDEPAIFLTTAKIQDIRQLVPIFDIASERPLLIVGDLDVKVSATIASNVVKHGIQINVINTPEFGPLKQEMMEDLADLTGAKLHGAHLGDASDIIDESFLGSCHSSITDESYTTLRFKEKPNLSEKVKFLTKAIETESSPDRRKQYKNRLAMIAGAIGVVYVGAPTEPELKEKMDKVEDAVYAVYAARDEGILPGGGVALKNASEVIRLPKNANQDYKEGFKTVARALKSPFVKILDNAGIDTPGKLPKGVGIDVIDGEVKNMRDAGIVDPLKITRQALTNAVSVAKTILGTNVTIHNIEV